MNGLKRSFIDKGIHEMDFKAYNVPKFERTFEQLPNESANPRPPRVSATKCFNCGSHLHLARRCTKPKSRWNSARSPFLAPLTGRRRRTMEESALEDDSKKDVYKRLRTEKGFNFPEKGNEMESTIPVSKVGTKKSSSMKQYTF